MLAGTNAPDRGQAAGLLDRLGANLGDRIDGRAGLHASCTRLRVARGLGTGGAGDVRVGVLRLCELFHERFLLLMGCDGGGRVAVRRQVNETDLPQHGLAGEVQRALEHAAVDRDGLAAAHKIGLPHLGADGCLPGEAALPAGH
ncbi:MAG TPA: hypothetical protein PLT93_16265, partial [Phycisphaerae bacterium]|nr:hypothetical protein [Phycisphaerae bacterium]